MIQNKINGLKPTGQRKGKTAPGTRNESPGVRNDATSSVPGDCLLYSLHWLQSFASELGSRGVRFAWRRSLVQSLAFPGRAKQRKAKQDLSLKANATWYKQYSHPF